MRTKHLNAVHLSAADRAQLDQLLHAGTTNTRVVTRARILLKCAAGWTDAQCADAFEVHLRTVRRVRERFVADGIARAVYDRPRSGAPVKLDGKLQALVVATACSPAPTGHTHWTLRLLADRFVELEVVDHIAPNTVRAILKKTS